MLSGLGVQSGLVAPQPKAWFHSRYALGMGTYFLKFCVSREAVLFVNVLSIFGESTLERNPNWLNVSDITFNEWIF
jgi:hypothetical protein